MTSFHDPDLCRSILENLPSGLCVLDMEKKIVFWSNGAERITGYLRHEVVGHSCVAEAVLHCDQSGAQLCKDDCPIARTIKTAQPVDAIGLLHHKAGHEFPVRIHAVPVHNGHGSIIGAVETFEELQSAAPDLHEYNLKVPGCVDDVTGMASVALMRFHLRQALNTFVEVQVPFSMLCLRLEGLQHFRASLGPEAGASLLRVVARSLETTFWRTDHVGRWSDDQFLVILNGCREESLHSVGDRVIRRLARDGIEWWGERRSLPILIGEATVQPGDTIESLIARAQKSLETAAASRVQTASASGGNAGS